MLEKTKNLVSVSCDFEQIKQLDYLDATINSSGKLWFDNQNRLCWEYTAPFQYLIVLNKGKFQIKTDQKVSAYDVSSNPMFAQMSELITSSVNGSIFTNPEFEVEALAQEATYVIDLKPRNQHLKKLLSKITITIDKADFSVNQVVMYEQEENYT